MSDSSLIVVPGEEIVGEAGFLRGHGTYAEASTLVSSLAGVVERVNRLITVRPPHSRYSGEVGDVIVGRVRSVGSKQWRVDVGARQDAVLQLSAINLEGGTLRRRTLEDQLSMRSYYSEADVLSAEVHSVMGDGSLSLHARSAKYGLLTNGVLVCVPPGLMRRVKQHFVTLPPHVGCDAILGLNGYIWITGMQQCMTAVSTRLRIPTPWWRRDAQGRGRFSTASRDSGSPLGELRCCCGGGRQQWRGASGRDSGPCHGPCREQPRGRARAALRGRRRGCRRCRGGGATQGSGGGAGGWGPFHPPQPASPLPFCLPLLPAARSSVLRAASALRGRTTPSVLCGLPASA